MRKLLLSLTLLLCSGVSMAEVADDFPEELLRDPSVLLRCAVDGAENLEQCLEFIGMTLDGKCTSPETKMWAIRHQWAIACVGRIVLAACPRNLEK